jgi:hypothetical protein
VLALRGESLDRKAVAATPDVVSEACGGFAVPRPQVRTWLDEQRVGQVALASDATPLFARHAPVGAALLPVLCASGLSFGYSREVDACGNDKRWNFQ